ncbi:hypothetical protein [Natranaerobius thermophilus]|uniref:Uncharacterized protein n=1 Tax=Natranaerobius thermophilus (strain ATCC BAA-1301 / DSM 18059 / JW/NM-WN-LF) TaxID=457570 RepID=B2A1F8_NATTJ|nr:hypothetical protein [Natranaerobius thermophilus]ACB84698.1 hypothetical protein Nther_1115 [Natranaerobius thermophilus JW/NM-WN-LF]
MLESIWETTSNSNIERTASTTKDSLRKGGEFMGEEKNKQAENKELKYQNGQDHESESSCRLTSYSSKSG